jgi:hypothetical protein
MQEASYEQDFYFYVLEFLVNKKGAKTPLSYVFQILPKLCHVMDQMNILWINDFYRSLISWRIFSKYTIVLLQNIVLYTYTQPL